ncbi:MAG TPA: multidrug efflux SMR transporter [Gammaproteobacteria bacterium]|jgi:small multidrug resistance pump|nr:multidrug efflux SMR transporter [Gammaproteobacteria bacterium]
MNMASSFNGWLCLSIAILFGVLGTSALKLSHGLTKIKPVLCLSVFYSISFTALTFAMKYIELSVVYAIWSGVGTALVAFIGILHFKESVSVKKIGFLTLIIVGVIGIHLADGLA